MRFPSEWRHAYGVHVITAFPADTGARFRWYERWPGNVVFSEAVERVVDSDPDFRVRDIGDTIRVVTTEGEYGAWVAIEGRRQGTEAMRFVGAVFADYFTSVLDCVAILPPHFAAARTMSLDLVRAAELGLGERPRPFYYLPPTEWQAVPSGPTVTWYPPDFPSNATTLAIPYAMRIPDHGGGVAPAEVVVETVAGELGSGLVETEMRRSEIKGGGGHPGWRFQLLGKRTGRDEPVYRDLALFIVDGRAYRMRLETTRTDRLAELQTSLAGVIESFRPLPGEYERRVGTAFASPSTTAFEHWSS